MTSSLGTVLRQVYQKSRVPLAYALVIVAFALRYAEWEYMAGAVLVALGLIVLPVIFETHKAVSASPEPVVFQNFHEAEPHIERTIAEYLKRSRPATIRCLGVALFHQWPFLELVLGKLLAESRTDISVELTLVDPTWEDLGRFNKSWREHSQGSYTGIEQFVNDNASRLADLRWSMKLYVYRSLPHWWGILIGEEALFLGTTYWEEKRVRAGANMVERYLASDVVRGQRIIPEFIGWFNYTKERPVLPDLPNAIPPHS